MLEGFISHRVKEINGDLHRGPNLMLIKEFLESKKEFLDVRIGHERREANGEAHRLARLATTSDLGRRV